MTRLVAQELEKQKIGYEYLHGGVPSAKRKDLLTNFHKNPDSKVFLSTDAGSVGLNLQCASFLVNLDCPWNPAVLEQRIARIHRFGQKQPIHVVNFISSGTIEEMIQETIRFKKSVFEGVLDNGADEVFMGENKFQQFMKGIEKIVPEEKITAEPDTQTSIQPIASLNERAHVSIEKPKIPSSPPVSLQDFFTVGVKFLEQLTHAMTQQNSAGAFHTQTNATDKNPLSSFIEKDQETGKVSFKIPMPDEATLNRGIVALDTFVKALKK